MAIKIGLEDCPPLLGAGVRFALAGLVLLGVAAAQGRPLRTDWLLAAVLALAPVRVRLRAGLLGRAVRAVRGWRRCCSGSSRSTWRCSARVLLPDEPLRAPLVVGVLIGIGGLALAFLESVELGAAEKAALGAVGTARSRRSARRVGNIAQKRRAARARRGRAERLGDARSEGCCSWRPPALGEDWGEFAWSAESVGSIAYLALFGSAHRRSSR